MSQSSKYADIYGKKRQEAMHVRSDDLETVDAAEHPIRLDEVTWRVEG